MARAQKIWNGVYIIGGSDITRPEDCCIYLVEAGEELVLIDAGAGRSVKKILDNITAVGLDPQQLTHIIATHGHIDHIGGLQEIKTRLDLQVVAHELELPAIEQGSLTYRGLYVWTFLPASSGRYCAAGEQDLLTDRNPRAGVCIHRAILWWYLGLSGCGWQKGAFWSGYSRTL